MSKKSNRPVRFPICLTHPRRLHQPCSEAELFAVASPRQGTAETFAGKHQIPIIHGLQEDPGDARGGYDCNRGTQRPSLRHDIGCRCGRQHIVMEKPLCLNLADADRMIEACRKPKSN